MKVHFADCVWTFKNSFEILEFWTVKHPFKNNGGVKNI